MTNEELNGALYDQMCAEQEQYRTSLLAMPPEKILEHAFEYAAREDILTSMEFHLLDDGDAQALLRVDHPLEKLFHAYAGEEGEIRYMKLIHECVENEAHREAARQEREMLKEQLKATPLYPWPSDYARARNEMELFRASRRANTACRDAIDAAIEKHFTGSCLNAEAVREVTDTFGFERTLYVLAVTVRDRKNDRRFSSDNRKWAYMVPVFQKGNDVLRSHSVKVEAFIQEARHEYLRENRGGTSDLISTDEEQASKTEPRRTAAERKKQPER